ncbi:hypothetical protein H5410_005630 [Solanum commersonii]|uniref:Uncharacterized protein n=1 Tax=Solanum commersonii TaxID=4109 RepID=A0A9J6A826_SOLCO|nr:hypothetical protein H5410_005630 [Solanum commersonii]
MFLAVSIELIMLRKEIMLPIIHRYSLLTNTWSYGMWMNAPKCLFGFASLGEIVILAASCDSRVQVALSLDNSLAYPHLESGYQRHAGDNSYSHSLIHAIGCDMSIFCLIHCSRFLNGMFLTPIIVVGYICQLGIPVNDLFSLTRRFWQLA